MNAEFNWWLLIVGLVIGGGLVWLVLLDSRRREDEVTAEERAVEARWLAAAFAEEGTSLAPDIAERVLDLHATYLATTLAPEPEPDEPSPAAGLKPANEAPVATPVEAPVATPVEAPVATPERPPLEDRDPAT